jgi:lipopolysaccharide export system permease protein
MIFILVDLVENVDKYIDKNATLPIVVEYYLNWLPWIFVIVTPVGLLLAANFTGISMARHNEVIAARSAGISAIKLAMPVYVFGLLWSVAILIFGELVVPQTSARAEDIKQNEIFNKRKRLRIRRDIYLIGDDGTTFSLGLYNPVSKSANSVSIVSFDDSSRVENRIDAFSMAWVDKRFLLRNATVRSFNGDDETYKHFDTLTLNTSTRPSDFESEQVNSDAMGFFELRDFIRRARISGYNPSRELTDLYVKLTFPFSNFIILLFSVPLALRMRKSGAALGLGISFVVAFTFFSLVRIGQSLGYNETLSPITAASLGNLVYLTIGLIVLIRFRD